MKKAFTIIELLVAIGLLAGLLAASGIIFKAAIDAQRTAAATAEITRKLRTITDQLNADFKNLLKDGEIFLAWVPTYDNELGRYVRFDRVHFFANGNFHTYHQRYGDIRGNIARVCYMLARPANDPSLIWPDHLRAHDLPHDQRILARTQHVYTPSDPCRPDFPDISNTPDSFTAADNDGSEYDTIMYTQWRDITYSDPCIKGNMLTAITDIYGISGSSEVVGGATVDTENPNSIHMLLAEGVGEFTIQGWYELDQRWVPEVDPDGDGDLTDTDFVVDPGDSTRLDTTFVYKIWYPDMPSGFPGIVYGGAVNEHSFNDIPGLGRALKFTFTLYDSRGIFPEGKVFTHIVYLDN